LWVSVTENLNYCSSNTESHTFRFEGNILRGFVTGRLTDGQAGIIHVVFIFTCLPRWSRGLRLKSAASRLLGLRVRIPPGAWMSIFCEFVCFQVDVSATNRSLVQRSPLGCGVSVCNLETSNVRWPRHK
jgi:hypothetical protein